MRESESFLDGKVILHSGDCLEVLKTLAPNSVDSIVTDPPYGLEFMGKEWDAPWKYGMHAYGMTDTKGRAAGPSFSSSRNPMCKVCHKHKRGSKNHKPCGCDVPQFDDVDHRLKDMMAFQAWCHAWAQQVYRVLKPGGHALIFGGTRTYHRMACAIEDAGFECRDAIMWHYGSGFPKSHDVSKGIDRAAGAEREVIGKTIAPQKALDANPVGGSKYGYQVGEIDVTAPATDAARKWQGWGTALKPATEIICLARKPLEGTVAANVLKWGTGAINIDGCRVVGDPVQSVFSGAKGGDRVVLGGTAVYGDSEKYQSIPHTAGRWPANIIHDGSDEVVGAFPDRDGASSNSAPNGMGYHGGARGLPEVIPGYADSGSAARFFYTAKADADDRLGSKHPTVKPLDLMQWLVRLVTPKGGLVLDPFAGTGTTGEAAFREGCRAILIEREVEYQNDIRRRMAHALAGPSERKHTIAKAKHGSQPFTDGLFATVGDPT